MTIDGIVFLFLYEGERDDFRRDERILSVTHLILNMQNYYFLIGARALTNMQKLEKCSAFYLRGDLPETENIMITMSK